MRITTPNGTLAVNADTEISLTLTNPMFEEQGSHALPFTVPWCEHNLHVLGHPELLSKAEQKASSIVCTIEADWFREKGELSFETIDFNSPIELSFLGREGLFYRWAKNTMLTQLTFPDIDFTSGGYIQMGSIISHANSPYPTSNFAIFPVVIADDGDYNYLGFSKPPATYQSNYNKPYQFKRILNNFEYPYNNNPLSEGSFVLWELPRLGIVAHKDFSPFLYVNSIIQFIFETAGIRLKQNDLTTNSELNRLVILNNAAYAVNNNQLQWDLLVPDISVMDFITSICNKFNLTLFIDYDKNEAELLFTDELISSIATKRVSGKSHFVSFKHKTLKITHSTLNDDFVKPSIKTIDEIVNDLDFTSQTMLVSIDSEFDEILYFTNDDSVPGKVSFWPASQYICIDRITQNNTGTNTSYKFMYKRFKVGCLSHQLEPESEDVKEIKSDAAIPGITHTMVPAYVWRAGDYPSSDHIRFNNGYHLAPRFMVPANSPDSLFTDEIDEVKPNKFPLCLCIYRGKLKAFYQDSDPPDDYPYAASGRQPYGSPFPYDRKGTVLKYSSEPDTYEDQLSLQVLGDNGLLENFFKNTQQFYNTAGLPIAIKNFDKNDFLGFKFKEKVLIDGITAFISKLEVTISQKGYHIVSAEGISAKPMI